MTDAHAPTPRAYEVTSDSVGGRAPGVRGRPNLRIKRNKLACFIAPVLAILFVFLIAIALLWAAIPAQMATNGFGGVFDWIDDSQNPFLVGMGIALFACMINFYMTPIIYPVTFLVFSQTVGRLAHRRVSKPWSYVRLTAIVGALLVGLTCTIPGIFMTIEGSEGLGWGPSITAGGFIMGSIIGGLAGLGVGGVFVAIVRPATQLKGLETSIAEAF